MLLRAKYVLPVDGPLIKNGAVGISRRRVVDVGRAKHVDGAPRVDFGDAVILPGMVNAHTHLELGFCAGKQPPNRDFVGWLKGVMGERSLFPDLEDALAISAREGMRQSLLAGVTTLGDIAARPEIVRPVLKHGPLRVVSFGEITAVGSRRELLSERLQAAVDGEHVSDYLTIGISPHAPYSVEPDGMRACVEAGERLNLPMSMHLAETRQEEQFTRNGEGPFRDLLFEMGILDSGVTCPGISPVALAHNCGMLCERTVLAHCNYVSQDDLALLSRSGAHVAYCPRTHAVFEHDPHPFGVMLEAGINVCIGTDSLASTPSLSVLGEIRQMREAYPLLDAKTLMEMATIRGARALGLSEEVGSLSVGKSADVTVIPLDPGGPVDPVENLLMSSLDPLATFVRGIQV